MGDEARLSEDETGEVTCAEAREILGRYNASHFGDRKHEHARYSIPADPRRDDDIRLGAFIDQAERDRAALAAKDEEIAALRAEQGACVEALGIDPPDTLLAACERIGKHAPRLMADLTRLRAREERTAAVIEAARDAIDYIDNHIVEATGSMLARLEDLDHILTPAREALDALDATPEHARGVERAENGEPEQVMPRVNGKHFRCECGANVFSRQGRRYTCNGCGDVYVGEPVACPDQRSDAAKREGAPCSRRPDCTGTLGPLTEADGSVVGVRCDACGATWRDR